MNAGSRMCQPITQKNCRRERISGSSVIVILRQLTRQMMQRWMPERAAAILHSSCFFLSDAPCRTPPNRKVRQDRFHRQTLHYRAVSYRGPIRCNEQQRVRRVAGPASLGDEKIQPQRREVVREGVHFHVARLIQHLRVGVALVAGLGFDRPGIAFDSLQRQRTSLAAGDACSSHMIPRGRAKRAIEIARSRRPARCGHHA